MKKLKQRKVLITGASGQDGTYLIESLLKSDAEEIHCITSKPLNFSENNIYSYSLDLKSLNEMSTFIEDLKPDVIYNLAAVSSVADSWKDPVLTLEVNGLAVASMLETCLSIKNRYNHSIKFIQASSAEIFGNADISPQSETTPISPNNPYGSAKAYAHLIVQNYRQQGIFASNCILYNHESPLRPEKFVTQKIIQEVVKICRGLSQELRVGNIEVKRDWGWAPDYVEAMIKVAEAEKADDYIVATGQTRSIKEFIAEAFQQVGIKDWEQYLVIDPKFFRPSDSSELKGDSNKINKELGWRPTKKFSGIVKSMIYSSLIE